jgi:hypothetical protein
MRKKIHNNTRIPEGIIYYPEIYKARITPLTEWL